MMPNWENLSYNGKTFLQDLVHIIPELKESEDEKVRKKIIATIHLYYGEPLEDEAKEMTAWLEKQGNLMKALQTSNARIGELIEENYYLKEQFEKQGEQKPVEPQQDMLSQEKYAKAVDECIYGEQKPSDKIEPKSATMSLDEAIEHCKEKSCGNSACALEHKQLEKWLIELKELKEQKPAWSEEDEVALSDALWCCKQAASIAKYEYDMGNALCAEHWLKHLKERVLPQKQEWSEEDKAILEKCIGAVKVSCYSYSFKSEAENWLKSLRPQKKWPLLQTTMEDHTKKTIKASQTIVSSIPSLQVTLI